MANLKTALANKHITVRGLADFLGIAEKSAHNKLSGATDFTFPEAQRISTELFPEYNITYLFSTQQIEKAPAKSARQGKNMPPHNSA